MKRVLVGPSAFRISGPGYDVTQAAANQLIFDAFGGVAYNGVYLLGMVSGSAMSNGSASVSFGKTFSAPPGCIVRLISPHTSHALIWNYQAPPVQGRSVDFSVTVTTTGLTVTVSGSGFAVATGFVYLAMQV